jgi:chaperonin GroEL
MSKKIVLYGSDARKGLQAGVNVVVKAVETSYGPAGRTSVLDQGYGAPSITNDGVTIAKAIELEGVEQSGVALMQQAADKTNSQAGDGTSTTTIIAGSLINEGLRVVEAGGDPVKVRIGMKKAVDFVLDELNKIATPIKTRDEKANVATISSRSSEIGNKVADILEQVGQNGIVTVQNGDSNSIVSEVTQGMQFDKGYKSPYFVTDKAKMEAIVEKPLILITDRKIATVQDLLPIIKEMTQSGRKDLVLIAEDIEGEALTTFILNKLQGLFNFYAVQAPAFGDRRKAMLEDIAILTGATFISSDLGMQLKTATLSDLGSCGRVIITKDSTTIIDGKGDEKNVIDRINAIKQSILETKSDYDKEKLAERLAKLSGGVAVIKVGANTEVEMKELRYVVEDALNATKAAIAEGVVPGGASTLVRLASKLDSFKLDNEEENTGVSIVRKALIAPFRAIAKNSGVYDIAILQKDIESNVNSGFDFSTMQPVSDMIKSGIIDPKMVVREAISNASSIAGSIITTEVAVINAPSKDGDKAAMPNGMEGMGMGY